MPSQNRVPRIDRRQFLQTSAAATLAAGVAPGSQPLEAEDQVDRFSLRYILGSCMYGKQSLAEILPEAAQVGARAIDVWPKPHGNQREQIERLGEKQFTQLLQSHQVKLGCLTQYVLGPFGLQDEMRFARRHGCHTIVTGGSGPTGLSGTELKSAIKSFVEQMKPHLEVAAANQVTIAIENHGNNLIDSPDSLKWLVELSHSDAQQLGIALAPYHLPQDERLLAQLIRQLGNRISMFYAWQYGQGCMTKLPKAQELLQMPGRGPLDFEPLLSALRSINYRGWTEIFMHPVPRGVPILNEPIESDSKRHGSTAAVTQEINRARKYLDDRLN